MEDGAYQRECAELVSVWERLISGADGPLPGSLLDALITPRGWCGHVRLAPAHRAAQVMAAADAIAQAYGLQKGSVVVHSVEDETAAFVWAYNSRSAADYHTKWPHPVLDGSEFVDIERVSSGASLLDLVRLTSWARAYHETWTMLRTGGPADVQQFVRRLNRLRAGILDILERAKPWQVRELLMQVGVPRESLPDDLATVIDYPRDHERTIPIPR